MFEPPGDTPPDDRGACRPPPPKRHYSGDEVSRNNTSEDSDKYYKPYYKQGYTRVFPESTSKGEYSVFVESTKDTKLGNQNPITLGSLFKNEVKGVKNIKRVNANKVSVLFEQTINANAFLKNSDFHTKNDFKVYIPARAVETIGVVRFVPTSISNEELFKKLSSSHEIIGVRRFMKRVNGERKPLDFGELSILCAYSPPRGSRFKCRRLKQIIDDLPTPMLLAGDLNAHHVAFGCRSTNSRGNDVYNLLDECNLCILNTGAYTTVGNISHNQSAIDIACVTPSIAPFCHWRVHDDPMGSYHYPTICDIYLNAEKYEVNNPSDRYLYKKANWTLFNSETGKAFKEFSINTSDPLSCYDKFISILNIIKDKCIPKATRISQYINKKPVPWWDNECADAVKKSKDALNYYRLLPSTENFIKYKRLDAIKKKLLRQKKKE
ncbi:RNA-directed DNA polymerase from mobile element jockey [Danaus plexippus plexippus]|uniref:RNA-directed DNA polymerase from mobile element jockey n=1 Tax=Danaus plexippus plexippus TaxID=278856 RepID=A0A212FNZ5_DANPL|nr:RNA-directed DNA polymerase from mobile element jockey [Danaus plexippus plexippus]